MLNPAQLDRVVALCPVVIPLGFAIGWLTGAFMAPCMLVILGACGGSLHRWRHERGLWMLAALFLSCWGSLYGLCVYSAISDLIQGKQRAIDVLTAVDFALSTAVLGVVVRFLWSVIWWNRRVGTDVESSLLDDELS